MTRQHTGASSGIVLDIPELTDRRDIEVAFMDFADSIPAYPSVRLNVVTVTGDTAGAVQAAYFYNGANPINVSLPANPADGDRVVVYQAGSGKVTYTNTGNVGGGLPDTGAQFGICTAVFVNGSWWFTPFGYSGTLPTTPVGGDHTVDGAPGGAPGGKTYRYHIYTSVGPASFTSVVPATMVVEAFALAGGSPGTAGDTIQPGTPGRAGDTFDWTLQDCDQYIPVPIFVGGSGQDSQCDALVAFSDQGPDVPIQVDADFAVALGKIGLSSYIGGLGVTNAGPAEGSLKGQGGGAGYQRRASYAQSSYVHSWTTGGSYNYDCSYGARAETYQSGTNSVTHVGDPCVGGQCPPGWSCVDKGLTAGHHCVTTTHDPIYSTRYHCDNGGSLSGTTCVKTCTGSNTQHHSETRWHDCQAEYVADDNRQCVDVRSISGGPGAPGLVAIRYPF
jgi:hypothetical protein